MHIKCTNLGFRSQLQTYTWIKTSLSEPITDWKWGVTERVHPWNNAFSVAKTKKSFAKMWELNVLWHKLNYGRTLRRKILKGHSCALFRKWFNFVHLKNVFLKQSNLKKDDRNCTIIKYFRASKFWNRSVPLPSNRCVINLQNPFLNSFRQDKSCRQTLFSSLSIYYRPSMTIRAKF